jgi:Rrf2 family protein
MKLQKTTEYALQIMVFLSMAEKRPLSSNALHKTLGIPRKYLQRLLTRLSKRGLIRSTRGRTGGYVLVKAPRRISLLEVVESVERLHREPQCLFGFGTCPLRSRCALHDHWTAHHQSLLDVLSSTHLSDLMARPKS